MSDTRLVIQPRLAVPAPSNHAWKRISTGIGLLLVASTVGVTGYIIAGWRPLDAVYMVVITIFGVGYGEVRATESDGLRIFTIGLIVSGCSALVYIMGGIFQLITEGELNRALGRRRMTKDIEALKDHVIICGFGRIGRVLAESFRQAHVPFVVIDQDVGRIEEASEAGVLTYVGDASQEQVLEGAGVMRARALATVLPNDALNVFITLTARALNPVLNIVARGEDPRTERKLLAAGANRVVLPAAIGADHISHVIMHPLLEDLFSNDGLTSLSYMFSALGASFDLVRLAKDSKMIGRRIHDLEAVGHGCMVAALRRADGTIISAPTEETVLLAGDDILLMGRASCLPAVAARLTKYILRDNRLHGVRS